MNGSSLITSSPGESSQHNIYHGQCNELVCMLFMCPRVKIFVTLGSPHTPPPPDTAYSAADQTRGLLSYINEQYPGQTLVHQRQEYRLGQCVVFVQEPLSEVFATPPS